MPNASLTIDGTEVIKKENGVVSLKNTNADTSLSFPANHAGIKTALNASGNPGIYACRAWVNFDGTNAFSPNPSTSAIRDSGNVSSISQNGTGDYTVNFATPMPDANYATAAFASQQSGTTDNNVSIVGQKGTVSSNYTSSSCRLQCIRRDANVSNLLVITASFFR